MLTVIETLQEEIESDLDDCRSARIGAHSADGKELAYAHFAVDVSMKSPYVHHFNLPMTHIANGWVTQHLIWIESFGSHSGPVNEPVRLYAGIEGVNFDLRLTIYG